MAAIIQYASTPKVGIGLLSVANTNRDGTGTLAIVLTAGANGSRIDALVLQATGTTTGGMIRLFVHDGTNARLYAEVPVQAATPGGTVAAWTARLNTNTATQFLPLIIPSGYSLRASTNNAETFNVIALGGDF